MNKEKEIISMADDLEEAIQKAISIDGGKKKISTNKVARLLINKGYGNIGQAVREFAEELKTVINDNHLPAIANIACKDIDQLVEEYYGEEDK